MTTQTESLDSLERAADYPIDIELHGANGELTTVTCRKLRVGWLGEAAAWLRQRRRREYFRDAFATDMTVPQISRLHAEVLQNTLSQPMSPFDIINDAEGRLKLLQMAINAARGSKDQLSYEQVEQRLAHVDQGEFFRKVCLLSGVYVTPVKEVNDEEPDPSEIGGANITGNVTTPDPGTSA